MSWDLDPEDQAYYCSKCQKEVDYEDFLYSDICEECEMRIDEVPDYIPSEQVDKFIKMKGEKNGD